MRRTVASGRRHQRRRQSVLSPCRRAVAALLALALLAGLAGCSASDPAAGVAGAARQATSRPPVSPSSLTVGYVGVGDTEGGRAEQMERATINGLREAGVRVMTFRSLSLNPQPQITAAQSFASKGIDALIVDPQFSNVWGDAFATIRDQGIKVILLDRTPLGMSQSRYDAYLGCNYDQLGRQTAQWVLGRLGRWTTKDQTYEYGGTPRSLIVSSLLGSAPDNKAADGWADQAGWLMETVDTLAVGEDHETAVSRLSSAWNHLRAAGTLPHVIFATNQTAASATLDLLDRKNVRLVADPAQALRLDAGKTSTDGWAVAVVCLAGHDWISARLADKRLAGGLAVPTDYSDRLVTLLTRLCAGIPVAKDEVVPGELLTH